MAELEEVEFHGLETNETLVVCIENQSISIRVTMI